MGSVHGSVCKGRSQEETPAGEGSKAFVTGAAGMLEAGRDEGFFSPTHRVHISP